MVPISPTAWSLNLAIIQIIGALYAVLRTSWEGGPNRIAISSTAVCLISLFIGDLGRRRSRANLLRFYMVASSIALIVSIYCVAKDNLTLQVIQDLSNWERHKFELLEISHAILGFSIQIFSVCTAVSLIQNMSPPKKAS
uniref:Uncharacterized protein n=1 Tax=Cannabis sativa TaxID=3483 RepID=A0A803QUP7_CANSA